MQPTETKPPIKKQRTLWRKRKRIVRHISNTTEQRHKAEQRFKRYGQAAIIVSLTFLALLLGSIISKGINAFWQAELFIPITFDAETVNEDNLQQANYGKLVRQGLKELFPEVTKRRDSFQLYQLASKGAAYKLQELATQDTTLLGEKVSIWLPASSLADGYLKHPGIAESPSHQRKINDQQIDWLKQLKENNQSRMRFNPYFFTSGDSREPELAGILGSLIGSIMVVLACMAAALPLGVFTGVYLEEFAKKNRLSTFIEVNINNLAAVPSIVFGLLGLALYLHILGIPRSAALAGGLTLALMILPIIVLSTRTALSAVPPSIREAALAIGASKMQTVLHHTLPLATPGIMTGTILGIARALGETAPLLMIGMVAFIVDIPQNFLDPATALPVQIYLWADSPEAGFVEKTSAAIIILLALLVAANALAVAIRKKYERKW